VGDEALEEYLAETLPEERIDQKVDQKRKKGGGTKGPVNAQTRHQGGISQLIGLGEEKLSKKVNHRFKSLFSTGKGY